MPTQLTKVDVWNLAIDHISEIPLGTPEDDNPFAHFLQRQYPTMLDAELRKNVWNFAVVEHKLDKDPVDPDYGWNFRYKQPNDALRILPPTLYGQRGNSPVEHQVNNGYIMSNAQTPLRIRTVQRIENPGQWDPLFALALAAALGQKMALRFTGKESYLRAAQAAYTDAIEQAQSIDAFEGSPEPVEQSDVINVRYDWYPAGSRGRYW